MKVVSGSSAVPRHTGPPCFAALFSPLQPPARQGVVFCSFFVARGGENKRNGQVGYTKHIRLYGTFANWPASFLVSFFSLSLSLFSLLRFDPATLTRILRSFSSLGDEEEARANCRGRARPARRVSPAKLSHQKSLEIVL